MVADYLRQFGYATRQDFEKLLLDKLSDALDDNQKRNLIINLLQEMRRKGIIRPVMGRRGKGAKWELCKFSPERMG